MALSDIYYQQPWSTQAGGQAMMQQGLGQLAKIPMENAQLAAQQQANTDAAYNSPARPANPVEQQVGNNILDLFPGPPHFKAQLHQELSAPGMAPQDGQGPMGPMQGPQGPAPIQNVGQGGRYDQSGQPFGNPVQPFGPPQSTMPNVTSTGGLGAGDSAPAPPQTQPAPYSAESQQQTSQLRGPVISFSQAPSAQPARPQGMPMTRGDVDLLARMGPIMRASQPPRDYMGEINARGGQQRLLEQLRQTGRLTLSDVRNAQRSLELGVKVAMDGKVLDERTMYHVNQIQLGYARIEAMANMLDKNIDFKRTSGADQMLKSMTSMIDSMTASESALIGSAFGQTPEGQTALMHMRAMQEKAKAIIDERIQGDTGAPPTTTTETKTVQAGGGARRGPAGVRMSAQPPPMGKRPQDPGTPDIPVGWKNRKTGETLQATQAQVDAADDKADWARQ